MSERKELVFSLETHPFNGMAVDLISDFGIGKTTFALNCGIHPEHITFINDDVKSPPKFGNDKNLGYQKYIDLMAETSQLRALEMCEYCLDMINGLDNGQVIIWDTFYRFENGLHPYVVKHPSKFRIKYMGNPQMIGSLKWVDSFDYESKIISLLKSKFNIVFLTRHIRNLVIDNKRIEGAFRPMDKKGIRRSADIRLWFLPTSSGGQVPSAIVLKNFKKDYISTGSNGELPGIKSKRILPPKVPKLDLDNLWKYWNNPVGDRDLLANERLSEDEFYMLTGSLTGGLSKDQFAMYNLMLKSEVITKEQEREIEEQIKDVFKGEIKNIRTKAKELKSEGMNNFQISKELKKLFPMFESEITIPVVKDWIS